MNQNPEQKARDKIDEQLTKCGWILQDKKTINLSAGIGIAIREYQTTTGPADYILFVDKKPVGIIEAKREEEGVHLTTHESQTEEYANSKLKYLNNDPLVFLYESTGLVTRFTDYRDPKPQSREVFTFHKPETFSEWMKQEESLRRRMLHLPELATEGLRECQISAITKLETSFKENRPRALIQMATGAGKTFTAITFIYRLLKYVKAKRILFLVDTKNLGEQAEQELMAYMPSDDNRKFTELYGVCRLRSGYIPPDNQVYVSTIQRLYSILKGTELEESAEEQNPNERWQPDTPQPVVYNEKVPIEFFDVVVIDECHRSIYNLWRQVLDYFDAFQVGLTATPDNRTFGYFKQNVVSEYTHLNAVADGVNVGSEEYLIETAVTKKGGVIWKGANIEYRERMTRQKRWGMADEDVAYTGNQLDRDVINPSQIRLVIRTFKEHLPLLFPDRYDTNGVFEVPKTLIFAKTDSHADDIINMVREVFAEENRFCRKLTYKTDEDPKSILTQFRNDYYPRIAVTVDMVATGTDVKPLEVLLFMRDVRSRNYYEQMKGRGTRTISLQDLQLRSPQAKHAKDHFVIVDAVGVTKSIKTDSAPMDRKPTIPLKDLLGAVAVGVRDEDTFSALASRLTRLEKQLTEKEKEAFTEKTGGRNINGVVRGLLDAYDPDRMEQLRSNLQKDMPSAPPTEVEQAYAEAHSKILDNAAEVFTGELNEYIEKIRRAHDQVIDDVNLDNLLFAGTTNDNKDAATALITEFKTWIVQHSNEITALQLFYEQPYRRRELTYKMIKELAEKLRLDKPSVTPMQLWRAYEQLEQANGVPKNELVALVSLVRRVMGTDEVLTAYDKTVDKNFQAWIFKKHAGPVKFNEEQMQWLRMIKEYIAASFHLEREDLDLDPFNKNGGLGRMWQLFGEKTDAIINELNEELAA